MNRLRFGSCGSNLGGSGRKMNFKTIISLFAAVLVLVVGAGALPSYG